MQQPDSVQSFNSLKVRNINESSFSKKWEGLQIYQKRCIIVACILLIVCVIASIVFISMVSSWQPEYRITQQLNLPVPGQHAAINIKTVKIKEKKLLSNDANIDVTVTTIKSTSRRLQEDQRSPSILSFDNGKGVITQSFTPDDFAIFIDPDRVLAASSYERHLQASSVAPEMNLLVFDDQSVIFKAVEESILKQAAEQLNANIEQLTIEYQQTVRIDLKSDGLYHFEQNEGLIRSLSWKPRVQWHAYSGGSASLRSYIPQVLKVTDAEFSAQSQIEVSVNFGSARLLQSTEPTLQQETNIACRSRPVSYKKSPSKRKVQIVDETTFNCSYHCTGNATSRVCPVGLIKENKCGYKMANLTGKEKVRGRVIVSPRKECAQMRKKCKEKKEKTVAAKSSSQTTSQSAAINKPSEEITKNVAIPAPTPTSESQAPSALNQNK